MGNLPQEPGSALLIGLKTLLLSHRCCAIEEHGEQRLTCWYRNWEDHHQKHPNKFGQADDTACRSFVAVQGDPGTPVGLAARWMGETDIALAKLNDGVIFENNFKEMVFSAKTSVHSDDQWMADSYIIDSALACVYRHHRPRTAISESSIIPKVRYSIICGSPTVDYPPTH